MTWNALWNPASIRRHQRLLAATCAAVVLATPARAQVSGDLTLRERLSLDGHTIELGRVGAIVADRTGNIYVADVHEHALEILVFNEQGRRVGKIGRAGDGPGEFRFLLPTLAWHGDTLLTASGFAGRRRLTSFHDQQVRGTREIPPPPTGRTESGVWLFSGGTDTYALQTYVQGGTVDNFETFTFPEPVDVYYRIDATRGPVLLPRIADAVGNPGRTQSGMVPCRAPDGRRWSGFPVPFSDRGPLRAFLPSGGVAVAHRDSFRIDVFNVNDGRITRTIRRSVAPIRLTDAVWEALPEVQELRQRERAWGGRVQAMGGGRPCAIYDMRPGLQPVIRTLLADQAGNLWVEIMGQRGEHSLGMIDARGNWVGAAPMPNRDPGVTPYVRDNRLYVATIDDLRVQGVKVYDIQLPRSR